MASRRRPICSQTSSRWPPRISAPRISAGLDLCASTVPSGSPQGWVFCRRAFELDGEAAEAQAAAAAAAAAALWPDAARDAPYFRELVQAHLPLVQPLAACILEYLGCDPHQLDAALARPAFGLRLNYYPPCTAADLASGAGRMLGHEDMDLFTLLPRPSDDGLQVTSPPISRPSDTGLRVRRRLPESL